MKYNYFDGEAPEEFFDLARRARDMGARSFKAGNFEIEFAYFKFPEDLIPKLVEDKLEIQDTDLIQVMRQAREKEEAKKYEERLFRSSE